MGKLGNVLHEYANLFKYHSNYYISYYFDNYLDIYLDNELDSYFELDKLTDFKEIIFDF